MTHEQAEVRLLALLDARPALARGLEEQVGPEHFSTTDGSQRLLAHLRRASPGAPGERHVELCHLARLVRRGARAREARRVAARLLEGLRRDPGGVDELVADTLGTLVCLTPGADGAAGAGCRDLGTVASGLDAIDSPGGGLPRGALSVFAARPAMGLTSLAMQVVGEVLGRGERVAVFSSGRSRGEVIEHMALLRADLAARTSGRPPLSAGELARLAQEVEAVATSPLRIDSRRGLSVAEVAASAQRAAEGLGGIDLVLVDGLAGFLGPRGARAFEVLGDLRALAEGLACAVLVTSGLTRAVETRADKRPRVSDLRARRAIERHAARVFLLHRPEYYRQWDQPGMAELICVLGSDNCTGMLHFEPQQRRFREPDDERVVIG